MSAHPARTRLAFFTEVGVVGGAERFLRDVVHGLDRDRYDVQVLCAENPSFVRYLHEYPEPRPFEVTELRVGSSATSRVLARARPLRRYPLLYRWRAVPKGLLRQARNLRNWRVVVRALRDRRIDILHINNGGYPGGESCRLAAIAARAVGLPMCVMTYHNLAEPLAFPRTVERSLDRRVFASLRAIVAASQASAQSLREVRGFDGASLGVIPYGIPDPPPPSAARQAALRAELGFDSATVAIGAVGSFEPRKGQEWLVRAVPTLRSRFPTVKVLLVGEGERRSAVQALARQLGVGDAIVFTGYRSDVLDIVYLLDAVALPSTGYESLPYVVIEAMALGKPVVGTRVAGVPEEIVDGVTGKLVPPADSDALAEALVAVLADKSGAEEMGRRGRARYLAEFTLSRMLARLERLYSSDLPAIPPA